MAFTKVTGPGIHTLANITSHNINSSGIITATKFVGPLEASSGSTGTFDSLTVTGNVSVGGTLTYEDVTNIDSVGIITARDGLKVLAGGANVVGVITATSVNLTGASSGNYLNVGSSTVFPNAAINIHRLGSGYSDIRLSSNYGAKIAFAGASNNTDEFYISQDNAKGGYVYNKAAAGITFGTNNTSRMWLDAGGNFKVSGISTFNSSVDVSGALDVDGQTDLDVLNVAETATFAGDISIADKIIHTGDTNTAIRFPTADTITAETGGDERIRITSAGQVLVGTDSNRAINAHAPRLQLSGTDYSTTTVSLVNNAADATGAYLFFTKQRSGSAGGSTAVAQDDIIGDIRFTAGDGTDVETGAARITVVAESNAGSNSVPSYMRFSTTSTTTPVERLRITSGGVTQITKGTSGGAAANTDAALIVDNSSHTYIQFRTPATKEQGLLFGDDADNDAGTIIYDHSDNALTFGTGSGGERLRITSGGEVGIGITNPDAYEGNGNNLVVGDTTSHNGITILTGTDKDGRLGFADGTGAASYRGMIEYQHGTGTAEFMKIVVAGDEALRIRDNGNVSIASSLAVTGVTTSNAYDLSAIDKSISDTAVDIFVYDTRKDSDGGAWRKRTSHTTWYSETFDSKRGSKKEFPAVAVIVAENDTLTIYDGDDPEMPMWMVFDAGGSNGTNMIGRTNEHNKTIHMLNGLLCVGRDYFGIHMINFIDDRARFKENGYDTPYLMPIGTHRNGSNVWALDPNNEGNDLSDDMVNDIAMTVLPNAPIDASTGLPIPTIAVATNIGVTVMTTNDATTWENGKTWDVYMGNTTYDTVSTVQFTKDGKVVYADHNGSQYGWMYVHDIPYQDTAITVNNQSTALSWYDTRDAGSESTQGGHSFADQDGHIYSSGAGYGLKILHTVTAPDNMIYATTTSGVTMIQENRGENRSALVAYITHSYNTGWLHGDQKFCLSDTDDTDKTNTQTEYDRSIGAKNLTAYGTVYKTAVATGAEMVSWSFGNSESNYLKQAYTAKLQFGTASFSVMGWFKKANYSSTGFIFDRADSSGNERVAWYFESDDLKLYTYNGSDTSEIGNGTVEIGSGHDGKWIFAVSTRHSSGLMETYINGALRHSQVSTVRNVDNGDAHLIVGGRYNNTSGNQFNGEIALLRMSKSVPSAEQVAKIYNDEKDLFTTNAKCALYGSSSSITALAHDEDTDTLHVGTSGGRSDFTGLNRINNTTTAVTTVISASNGLIIEQ